MLPLVLLKTSAYVPTCHSEIKGGTVWGYTQFVSK